MARILIAGFCSLPGPDRAGVQLGHRVKALTADHTVDVLCLRRADQAYVERRGKARILRVPVADPDLLDQVEAFRRAIRRQLEGADYDVVIVRDGWSGVPVLAAREAQPFAFVFDAGLSGMADDPHEDDELASRLDDDEDECLQNADMVLAATDAARQYLATRCPPERVFTVPLGVDVDLFDWDDPEVDGVPRILCVGPVQAGPGLALLVAAMRQIIRHSDAVLTLLGPVEPTFGPTLFAELERLGLGERVEVIPEKDNALLPERIARATVCVVHSAAELSPRPTTVFPTRILEYLACRRGVVAPRSGSVTLLMRDRQHGLLFHPGDPTSLANQVLRLLGDAELRDRLARAGYELVRREHTASASRRALRRSFEWLRDRGPWRHSWIRDAEEAELEPMPAPADADLTDSLAVLASSAHVRQRRRAFGENPFDEDHTMVEADPPRPPPRREDDTSEATTLSAGSSDDWVVDSGSTRAVASADPVYEADEIGAVGEDSIGPSVRFVAGELEVPAPKREPTPARAAVDVDPSFTAMSPLLGTQTATRVAPARAAGKGVPRRRADRDTVTDPAPAGGSPDSKE